LNRRLTIVDGGVGCRLAIGLTIAEWRLDLPIADCCVDCRLDWGLAMILGMGDWGVQM
jgi:hypothetical protein